MKRVEIGAYGAPEEVARVVEAPDLGTPGPGEIVYMPKGEAVTIRSHAQGAVTAYVTIMLFDWVLVAWVMTAIVALERAERAPLTSWSLYAAALAAGRALGISRYGPEQLDFLRASLERLRMDLRARLEREQGTAREAEPQVEPIDAAEQTREQDDAISFAERDRARLREVEDALRRMSAGSYGVSVISGEPIAFERLLAVPWARYDADEEP